MKQPIVVVGATGDLGLRIVSSLKGHEAQARCLVRKNTSPKKLLRLKKVSAEIVEVDFNEEVELARACEGASVVVSGLSGLRSLSTIGACPAASIASPTPEAIKS